MNRDCLIFVPTESTSIGTIRERIKTTHYLQEQQQQQQHQKPKNTSRCVHWKNEKQYTCLRAGQPFESQAVFLQKAANKELKEDDLFIFRHVDVCVERNPVFPKYEGVFKCGSQFIKAQKAHLAQAYVNSNRTNRQCAAEILSDETPYWVDRYAVSKTSRQSQGQQKRIKTE